MIELPRRKFLAGLAGIIAAPAIVRASSLMPVRGYVDGPQAHTVYFLQRRGFTVTMDPAVPGGDMTALFLLFQNRMKDAQTTLANSLASSLFSDAFPQHAPATFHTLLDPAL